jgi:hypothetical protein
LKSQLRIELIKLETKDCFINGIKSRGSLAIDPGVKLKKKGFHKVPIAKCQKFRGKFKISILGENGAVSK